MTLTTKAHQLDFFVADFVDVPNKDAVDAMPLPFFALGKRPRTTPIVYEHGNVQLKVTAPSEYGIATIFDADLLLWALSQVNEAKERGESHGPRIVFHPYDLLKAIKRDTGGRQYELLRGALRRLTATTVETNVRVPGGSKSAQFHWLELWREEVTDKGQSRGMMIELPQWLYEAVLEGRVLTIDPDYFRLTSGIGRWLYRMVRKHAGHQSTGWAFTIDELHRKSGSTQALKYFARDLRKVVTADGLPGYHVELYKDRAGKPCVWAIERSKLPAQNPAYQSPIAAKQRRLRGSKRPA